MIKYVLDLYPSHTPPSGVPAHGKNRVSDPRLDGWAVGRLEAVGISRKSAISHGRLPRGKHVDKISFGPLPFSQASAWCPCTREKSSFRPPTRWVARGKARSSWNLSTCLPRGKRPCEITDFREIPTASSLPTAHPSSRGSGTRFFPCPGTPGGGV